MSRAQLTSTDQQNSGGPVSPFLAGKNKIINGDFYINQRGLTSSGTTSGFAYTLDRWEHYATNGNPTVSVQAFTPGAAPIAGYEGKQFYRCNTSGVSTGSGDSFAFSQYIEGVRTFAGQTATISFWCKTASGTPNIGIALEQYCGTGGSDVLGIGATVALTGGTTWTRYSVTFSVPSLSGKTMGTAGTDFLGVYFVLSAGSSRNATFGTSAGQTANTFDFWGIQFEAGPVATPFTTASGTLQGELALCQRYYYRASNTSSNYPFFGTAWATSSTQLYGVMNLPVPMRVMPTSVDTVAANNYRLQQGGGIALTGIALDGTYGFSSPTTVGMNYTVSSGATANNFYYVTGNFLSTAYIGVSAEL
jgi:hypothetical protein